MRVRVAAAVTAGLGLATSVALSRQPVGEVFALEGVDPDTLLDKRFRDRKEELQSAKAPPHVEMHEAPSDAPWRFVPREYWYLDEHGRWHVRPFRSAQKFQARDETEVTKALTGNTQSVPEAACRSANLPKLVRELSLTQYNANELCEDAVAVRTSLKTSDGALFAVFDGHSGPHCAAWLASELFDVLEWFSVQSDSEKKKLLKGASHLRMIRADDGLSGNGPLLTREACLFADHVLLTSSAAQELWHDALNGSCGVIAHLHDDGLLQVANVGDCRCLVISQSSDGAWHAKALTRDHEMLENDAERERLLQRHPEDEYVVQRMRVKGRLQPTRVFGDAHYKRALYFWRSHAQTPKKYAKYQNWNPPYVSAEADVRQHQLGKEDRYVILACDGLFQDLTNEDVAAAVQRFSKDNEGMSLSQYLVREALLEAARAHFGNFSREALLTMIGALEGKGRRRVHDDGTAWFE
ncbi:MAG: hypothetical protein MHM6MM_005883 [Cercozoa sp. M6MM]